jgi:hypothetical protein
MLANDTTQHLVDGQGQYIYILLTRTAYTRSKKLIKMFFFLKFGTKENHWEKTKMGYALIIIK